MPKAFFENPAGVSFDIIAGLPVAVERYTACVPMPVYVPNLRTGKNWLAAFAIFLIVTVSTFPVVLPFVLINDVGTAKDLSRIIGLAILFFGGLALGRYAGYGSWKVGFMMAGLGAVLVCAIIALGG